MTDTDFGKKVLAGRVVLHVDLDCFYAAVEHERLGIPRDIPLAVQQWDGLIAVNYAARAKGVVRHDRVSEAKSKCPELRLVHVEVIGQACGTSDHKMPLRETGKASLERYRQASARVFPIFQRFASICERASIDEAYLDVTEEVEKMLQSGRAWEAEAADLMAREASLVATAPSLERTDVAEAEQDARGEKPEPASNPVILVLEGPLKSHNFYDKRLLAGTLIGARLRTAVKNELNYTCSVGVASNKLLAKLASAMNKPDRQTVIPPRAVSGLMNSLPLNKIKNLGGKLGQDLLDLGCKTAGDVQQLSKAELVPRFGKRLGMYTWHAVRGLHDEAVQVKGISKSMLAAKSFTATSDKDVISRWIGVLADELASRMAEDVVLNKRRPCSLHFHYRKMDVGGGTSAEQHSKVIAVPASITALLLDLPRCQEELGRRDDHLQESTEFEFEWDEEEELNNLHEFIESEVQWDEEEEELVYAACDEHEEGLEEGFSCGNGGGIWGRDEEMDGGGGGEGMVRSGIVVSEEPWEDLGQGVVELEGSMGAGAISGDRRGAVAAAAAAAAAEEGGEGRSEDPSSSSASALPLPPTITKISALLKDSGMQLFQRAEAFALPCSRLALSASNFVELPKQGAESITHFFSMGPPLSGSHHAASAAAMSRSSQSEIAALEQKLRKRSREEEGGSILRFLVPKKNVAGPSAVDGPHPSRQTEAVGRDPQQQGLSLGGGDDGAGARTGAAAHDGVSLPLAILQRSQMDAAQEDGDVAQQGEEVPDSRRGEQMPDPQTLQGCKLNETLSAAAAAESLSVGGNGDSPCFSLTGLVEVEGGGMGEPGSVDKGRDCRHRGAGRTRAGASGGVAEGEQAQDSDTDTDRGSVEGDSFRFWSSTQEEVAGRVLDWTDAYGSPCLWKTPGSASEQRRSSASTGTGKLASSSDGYESQQQETCAARKVPGSHAEALGLAQALGSKTVPCPGGGSHECGGIGDAGASLSTEGHAASPVTGPGTAVFLADSQGSDLGTVDNSLLATCASVVLTDVDLSEQARILASFERRKHGQSAAEGSGRQNLRGRGSGVSAEVKSVGGKRRGLGGKGVIDSKQRQLGLFFPTIQKE